MNLLEEAKKHYSEQIYSITADLHAHPELSFEEKRTSAIIRAQLEKLGIEILDLGLETGVSAAAGTRPSRCARTSTLSCSTRNMTGRTNPSRPESCTAAGTTPIRRGCSARRCC